MIAFSAPFFTLITIAIMCYGLLRHKKITVTPPIHFNDREIEPIGAGYINKTTGSRKIYKKDIDSYIAATETEKAFDARKVIIIMPQKLTIDKKERNNAVASELHALDDKIKDLIAQGNLPKNFVLSDDCVVHRLIEEVTYGELKQTQQPKIRKLKINFKLH